MMNCIKRQWMKGSLLFFLFTILTLDTHAQCGIENKAFANHPWQ